jgi:hypothetical protein
MSGESLHRRSSGGAWGEGNHSLCHWLIIEFIPKEDSQMQILLSSREDIFPDYTVGGFETAFMDAFDIRENVPIQGTQHVMDHWLVILHWIQPLGWEWEECVPNYWRVKVHLRDAPYSDTWRFYLNTTGPFCPPDLGLIITPPPVIDIPLDDFPIPTETPAPTATLEPTETSTIPIATLLENVNCRRGPGTNYEIVTWLQACQILPIDGRDPEGVWWWIRLPQSQNHCWVGTIRVRISGNVDALEEIPAPQEDSPAKDCWQYNQKQELECVIPCPQNPVPGGECTP